MSAYKVMLGQAGSRSIIRWQEVGSRCVGVSHFASVAEFLEQAMNRGRALLWYEEVGKGKKYVNKGVECGSLYEGGADSKGNM